MLKCAYVFKLLCKEVPDYGSCEPKHVAVCDVKFKWCAGRHIFVYDAGKHNGIYQNKKTVTQIWVPQKALNI